ncbi:hypothetical protein DdX_16444 [Ditylenchus destructor]|uniref:Uncharacterized protein n=1 Tax=Ditylenchus destructor TaxID=166010 RepID=A0AAD4MT51_9BILA|nr:hypothetical protein DdX_16444 [Ditylenchus destructor]
MNDNSLRIPNNSITITPKRAHLNKHRIEIKKKSMSHTEVCQLDGQSSSRNKREMESRQSVQLSSAMRSAA